MNAKELMQIYPEYEGQIEHIKEEDERSMNSSDPLESLPSLIAENLPFNSLYNHQSVALRALSMGEDVCVTTETASGKTLIYALDIARKWVKSETHSTSLLIYPTKALARDQKEELTSLYNDLNLDIQVGVYDGDVSSEEKRKIRSEADVIITNFQALNYYLPHHEKWSEFYSSLNHIVIDEAHSYTGVQGMHVSWIVRRLLRIADKEYSSKPQLILTSATIGNPNEHAAALTGRQPLVVSKDGSPQGKREIVFWNPPSYRDEGGITRRKSSHREAARVFGTLISKGTQTLLFTSSRQLTEKCAMWAEQFASDSFSTENINIEPYHAGHTKEERRRVEQKLNNGELDGVVSTTALEMGIDIGSMDAVVLDGFPGRKTSFWQRIGRAGRGTDHSLAVLVSENSSIDQFIVQNPDYVFEDGVENAVVNLNNTRVLEKHVLAASSEIPLKSSDTEWFTDKLPDIAEKFRKKDILVGSLQRGGLHYRGNERPEGKISLYSTSETNFSVEVEEDNGENWYLPDVQIDRAYREFHPEAIYLHKGQQYKVTDFTHTNSKQHITLKPVNVPYHTQSNKSVSIENINTREKNKIAKGLQVCRGTATVSEKYTSYKKLYHDNRDDEQIQLEEMGEIELRTDAIWIEINKNVQEFIRERSENPPLLGSLHAAEHSLIKMAPTALTVDNDDLGGLSISKHPGTGVPTIFIYDGIEGGVGFSYAIYEQLGVLTQRTVKRLQSCICNTPEGCPACTMSSSCGDNNEPLDKHGASALLEVMSRAIDYTE